MIVKANASASAPRNNKRPRIWDDDQSDSFGESGPRQSDKSILIRCIEDLFELEAHPFPRKHWNYQEGKNLPPHGNQIEIDTKDTSLFPTENRRAILGPSIGRRR